MATEEISARDAYQARAEGHVEEVTADAVVLDRTVFYARGGGQPGDVGVLSTPNGNMAVLDTVRSQGRILHVVESPELLEPGMEVEGIIDWDRRYRLMRTHTALHALSGVIYRDFGAKVVLQPANARLEPMEFEPDEVTVFGRVVTVLRRL